MDLGLKGLRALVTGASRGLGYAVARELLQEGVEVTLNARDGQALERSWQALGGVDRVHVAAGDVSQATVPEQVVQMAAAGMSGLDLLVTNAGGPPTGRFEALGDGAWQSAFELCFLSHVRLVRAALPYLRASRSAAVLTITSISAKQPIPDLVLSNSLRAGVLGLTKSLALELGAEGIRVNSILPAFTRTDRAASLLAQWAERDHSTPEAEAQRQSASTALGRIASPEEFARPAVFLLSPAASYLTGLMLPVDGGGYKGLL